MAGEEEDILIGVGLDAAGVPEQFQALLRRLADIARNSGNATDVKVVNDLTRSLQKVPAEIEKVQAQLRAIGGKNGNEVQFRADVSGLERQLTEAARLISGEMSQTFANANIFKSLQESADAVFASLRRQINELSVDSRALARSILDDAKSTTDLNINQTSIATKERLATEKAITAERTKQDNAAQKADAAAQRKAEREAAAATKKAKENAYETGLANGSITQLSSKYGVNGSGQFIDASNNSVIDKATDPRKYREARTAAQALIEKNNELIQQSHNPSLGGAFFGGLTSRGYISPPSSNPLVSLAGTAGVLAKYAAAGSAIGAVTIGASRGFQELQQVQTELVTLQGVQESLAAATGNSKAAQVDWNSAMATGISVGLGAADAISAGTVGVKNYSQEIRDGADANQVFTDSIKAAGTAAIITGQQVGIAQQNLLQAANAFGLKSNQQGQINDAVLAASRKFNASPSQILTGIGQSGDLAGVAGFDPAKLAATVGAIINTGAPPAGLARLLSKGGDSQFQGGLAALGVANTGDIATELEQMAQGYANLNDAQKLQFAQSVGGARSASILIALLQQQQQVTEAAADATLHAGAADQEAYKQTQTLGGQIREFTNDLKALAVLVGSSGLFTPLVVGFEAVKSVIEGLNQVLSIFDSIDGKIRVSITTVGELVLAYKALKSVGGGSAIGGVQTILGKIGGRDKTDPNAVSVDGLGAASTRAATALGVLTGAAERATAATAADSEAEARHTGLVYADGTAIERHTVVTTGDSASGAVGGITGLLNKFGKKGGLLSKVPGIGGFLGAETGFGGILGGAALTGGGLVAGAALGLGADALFAYNLHNSLNKQNKAITNAEEARITGDGTSDALNEAAKNLSQAAADSRHSSAGLLGAVSNFVRGNPTGDAAKGAQRQAEIAAQLAKDQKAREDGYANVRGGLYGINYSDSAGFGTYATAQQSAGKSPTEILKNMNDSLDNYLSLSSKSASYLNTAQSGVFSGQFADKYVASLIDLAKNTQTYTDKNGFTKTDKTAKKIANLNADQSSGIAQAAAGALQGYLIDNNLEGTDLSKVTDRQRFEIDKAVKAAVGQELIRQGIVKPDDQATILNNLGGVAGVTWKDILSNVNPYSGKQIGIQEFQNFLDTGQQQYQAAAQIASNRDQLAPASLTGSSASLTLAQNFLDDLKAKFAALQGSGKASADELELMRNAIDSATLSVEQINISLGQLHAQAASASIAAGPSSALYGQSVDQLNGILSPGDLALAATPGSSVGGALNQEASAYLNAQAAKALNDTYGTLQTQQQLDQYNRAYEDAQLAVQQARIQDSAASAAANYAIGDAVGQAYAQANSLRIQASGTVDPGARAQLYQQAREASAQGALAAVERANSQALAALAPGDQLGQANTQLANDERKLAGIRRATPGDLKGIADAQVAINNDIVGIVNAYSTYIQNLTRSQIDTTDPVAAAQAAASAAQQSLAEAQGLGLSGSALLPYQNAARETQQAAQKAAFDQVLQNESDQYQLHQISAASYLDFLKRQQSTLKAQISTMKAGQEGYQQLLDELTQVQKTILDVSNQATGQFNLGSIKVPTPYEVQRSIAASGIGAGYAIMPITNNTSITINGTDLAAVKAVLSQYLGNPLTTTTLATRKV